MDSDSQIDRLLVRIEEINGYLNKEAGFDELVKSLKLFRNRLNTAKPVVKIVSPSATLADRLKNKNLANSQLRSRYKFQTTAPNNKIQQIIQHCDLICFIYYFQQKISKQHQQLIELARQKNIGSILLVRQPDLVKDASLSDWLQDRDCSLDAVQLPLDDFIDLNQQRDLDLYQQFLWRSHKSIRNSFIARQEQDLKTLIKVFFNERIALVKQEDSLDDLLDKPPHYYQQQLQILNRIKQEQQQLTAIVKQNLNHLKLDLLNPFISESLMFSVRQIIARATVKAIPEAEATYLYLTTSNSVKTRYVHDCVAEFCQQKVENIIAFQWSQIEYVYGGGGLNGLIDKINNELKTIDVLVDSENDFLVYPSRQPPSLNLTEFIDLNCLKANTKIVFDYNFAQSGWFRLLISVVVGLGIYFITWIFLGSGKYIGLVIVVFQIINLITGQNPKKAKLKQHSKELKQLGDRQYQILVRLTVDKLAQTLITAFERETKLDRDKLERAIAKAQKKLERSNTVVAQNRAKIDKLQQRKTQILSLFS